MRIQLRGIKLNARHTSAYCLSLVAGLLSLFSSAKATAQSFPCTPVVYAFRHAEDNETVPGVLPSLTAVGDQHANLYPEMISDFEQTQGYCPVGWVYSMYDTKPDGNPGTTNPYSTAAPLAQVACNNIWLGIVFSGWVESFGPHLPSVPDQDTCGTRPD